MIACLLLLFYRCEGGILSCPGFKFQKLVLALFLIMPALSLVNLWDHYPSLALYSGNTNSGVIQITDEVLNRLPLELADYVFEGDTPEHSALDINEWSLGELNVPVYPEIRIFQNVTRRICDYGDVELVIDGQLALINSKRHHSYRCGDLK